jgi:hypothetical protein
MFSGQISQLSRSTCRFSPMQEDRSNKQKKEKEKHPTTYKNKDQSLTHESPP